MAALVPPVSVHRWIRTAGGYLATVLADSPVGLYSLGEPSGATMFDSSGNGFDGIYSGAPALGGAGLLNTGTSVAYSGANFSRIPAHAAFNANGKLTCEMWMKSASVAGGEFVCSDDTGGARYFRMELTGAGKLQALIFDTAVGVHTYTGAVTINDNARHHCAITYDGATILAYVDGAQDGAGLAAAFTLATSNGGIQIAERLSLGSDGNFYTGSAQYMAVYTQALSAARISAHYQAGL